MASVPAEWSQAVHSRATSTAAVHHQLHSLIMYGRRYLKRLLNPDSQPLPDPARPASTCLAGRMLTGRGSADAHAIACDRNCYTQ